MKRAEWSLAVALSVPAANQPRTVLRETLRLLGRPVLARNPREAVALHLLLKQLAVALQALLGLGVPARDA